MPAVSCAGEFTVLLREEVVKASSAILEAHGIAKDRSDDVRSQAALPKQCIGILAGALHLLSQCEDAIKSVLQWAPWHQSTASSPVSPRSSSAQGPKCRHPRLCHAGHVVLLFERCMAYYC